MNPKRLAGAGALAAIAALAVPAAALAQDEPTAGQVAGQLNTTWVIVAAVLVFFMQAGFAFLEIGFSRGKNVGAVIAKILTNFSVASLVWWMVGFGIAFGGASSIAGTDGFFLGFGD